MLDIHPSGKLTNAPPFFVISISWLARAASAAAAAAAFAAEADSSATLGFEFVFFTRSSSSSDTTLRIQDLNLGTIAFWNKTVSSDSLIHLRLILFMKNTEKGNKLENTEEPAYKNCTDAIPVTADMLKGKALAI